MLFEKSKGGYRGGDKGSRPPPGKSQMAIGFLKNSDTDIPQEAVRPIGST